MTLVNPVTGRDIKRFGPTYNKLLSQGYEEHDGQLRLRSGDARLPLELQVAIIGFLRLGNLRSVASVSKSWQWHSERKMLILLATLQYQQEKLALFQQNTTTSLCRTLERHLELLAPVLISLPAACRKAVVSSMHRIVAAGWVGTVVTDNAQIIRSYFTSKDAEIFARNHPHVGPCNFALDAGVNPLIVVQILVISVKRDSDNYERILKRAVSASAWWLSSRVPAEVMLNPYRHKENLRKVMLEWE